MSLEMHNVGAYTTNSLFTTNILQAIHIHNLNMTIIYFRAIILHMPQIGNRCEMLPGYEAKPSFIQN